MEPSEIPDPTADAGLDRIVLAPRRAAEQPPPAPRRVILESPFAGDVDKNVAYARAALRDSLLRGEAPLASHLLYTQQGVLDDMLPEERSLGIEAGLAWGPLAEATVVYADLGITPGMQQGIDRALREGRAVERRSLEPKSLWD